jgi:lysophospholipase L1-like esterase
VSARPIIAALGDSLTAGEHADGTPVHNHPWPALVDAALFPFAGVGQFGLGGDTIPGMQARYISFIEGQGFALNILWGGVNDIINDAPGATVFANTRDLVTLMLQDAPVLLALTPGFGTYVGWSPQRQAELLALRALLIPWAAATPRVTTLDLYQPYPAGMNDPNNLIALWPPGAYSDGLHINPDPGATHLRDLFVPKLAAIIPLPAASCSCSGSACGASPSSSSVPSLSSMPPSSTPTGPTRSSPSWCTTGPTFSLATRTPANLRTPIPGGWEFTVIADAGWSGATVSAFANE